MDAEKPDHTIVNLRVREALRAHARGWKLTPLNGKTPVLKDWPNAPAPAAAEVEEWARTSNLGLRTGATSGIVVIDEDPKNGGDASLLDLPDTVTVITGGGGRHFYFRSSSVSIGNSAGRLGPGLDVRGEGGQVVFPGSVHPETGNVYAWAKGRSPNDIEIADLPRHVIELMTRRQRPSRSERRSAQQDARPTADVVPRAIAYLQKCEPAIEGQGGDAQTFSVACHLVRGFDLDDETSFALLSEWNRSCQPPWDDHGLRQKIQSARRNGREPFGHHLRRCPADSIPDNGPGVTPARPVIRVIGGTLPEAVRASERALMIQARPDYFQRGGSIVRIVREPGLSDTRGVRRSGRAITIIPEESVHLALRLTEVATFERPGGEGKWQKIDCPKLVADALLQNRGAWKLPHLIRIIEAPTLRSDGSLLQEPGYDTRSRLFFDAGSTDFPRIPREPDHAAAIAALEQIRSLVQDFPFMEPFDESAAISAILTTLVRPSLPTAPLHAFDATTMGTGKSLLAEVASVIATGRPGAMMPQGKDEEEDRKRLLAVFLYGDSLAIIDNVERPLSGGGLCAALTSELYRDRVLGKSKIVEVPSCTTFIATGNNLVFEGDMVRRVVVCRMDAGCERPEERDGFAIPNLLNHVQEHRGQIVSAAITVLRAYQVAGRPGVVAPMGSFETWSNTVRSALVWCGLPDPCLGRHRIEGADPVRLSIGALIAAWSSHPAMGNSAVRAGELLKVVEHPDHEHDRALRDALEAFLDNKLSAASLGRRLGKYEGRIFDGRYITSKYDSHHKTKVWMVAHA